MSCHITAYYGTSWSLFLNINAVFNDEQEKESIICVRTGSKNLSCVIAVCHHSPSLLMPNSDPQNRFFYLICTCMMDSYIIH